MELKDKNVLILGASGGIGNAIASEFINKGSKLILHHNSKPIESENYIVKADICNVAEIELMFTQIKEKYQHLDIVINTIGIEESFDDQLDTSKWQKTFNTNLFGIVECTRQALKLMKNRQAVIINISSIMGNPGIVGLNSLAYSVSKAALQKFSENLSLMLAPNTRVVCVSPGYTQTPIWNGFSSWQQEEAIGTVPLKRFIQSEEIAKFIIAICANDAITGSSLHINGGLHLKSII